MLAIKSVTAPELCKDSCLLCCGPIMFAACPRVSRMFFLSVKTLVSQTKYANNFCFFISSLVSKSSFRLFFQPAVGAHIDEV